MESFQVEVILNSLRELQKEKCQNEKVLAGEFAKRKQLEAQLESTNAKLNTTSATHNKMKETLKVAELKVAQSQAQAKMFEQLNSEKRGRITQLNLQITQKDKERQEQIQSFETQMTNLTDTFRSAWHTQSDDALDLKQTQNKSEKQDCVAKIAANKLLLEELSRQLEHANLEKNSKQPLDALGGVPKETWKSTVSMFYVENQAAMDALKAKQHEEDLIVAELKEENAKLVKKLDDMQADKQHNEE